MQLADVLRKWRRASDLPLRSAAKQIGVTLPTLSRIERGEAMDGVTLAKILCWLVKEKTA